MDNFILHKKRIIEDFCNSFKPQMMKDIWGINTNCNVKSNEIVWLYKELLKYQESKELECVSGCTYINPTSTTIQYCSPFGTVYFPQI
jgi:hypothetical protein